MIRKEDEGRKTIEAEVICVSILATADTAP
jgi:hypothetical protein